MLLFVVDSQFDHPGRFLRVIVTQTVQQTGHPLVDGMSVFEYFGHRRPRQQSARARGNGSPTLL